MGDSGYTKNTGFQALAVTTGAAASLTVPTVNGIPQARAALLRVEGNTIYFKMDGTAPTSATGGGMPMKVADTAPLWIVGIGNLLAFQAIAITGAATLDVLYFN